MRLVAISVGALVIATTASAGAHELLDRFIGREPEHPKLVVERAPAPEQIEVTSSLQLRSAGSVTRVSGTILPVDDQMGALCGSLLAWRLGAQYRDLGLYGIAGGGTWTVYRHRLPGTGDDRGQIAVDSVRAGYGFVGLGGEMRLYKSLLLAAELDVGGLVIENEDDVIMAPSPTHSVRSAIAGLRFDY